MKLGSVSVVITCYNDGPYIREAVESILTQTQVSRIREIIVVDDGSAEETRRVLDTLRPLDRRITIILQENTGVSAARNRAIGAATGEFIAFLDADDLWLPQKLELQLPALDADPAVGLAYSDVFLVEPHDVRQRRLMRCQAYAGDPARVVETYFVHDAPIIPSCIVVRREVFRVVGDFDRSLRIGEDTEMCVRILAHFRCTHLAQATILKRERQNSLGADTMRNLGYYERATEKAVEGFPRLARLRGPRRARRLAKAGQYLEQAERGREAREYYRDAIRNDAAFMRAYALYLASVLPTPIRWRLLQVARGVKNGLRHPGLIRLRSLSIRPRTIVD